MPPGAGEDPVAWVWAQPECTNGAASPAICLQHSLSLPFSPLSGTILLCRVRLQVVTLSPWEIPGRGHGAEIFTWSQEHCRRASPGSVVVWEQLGGGWEVLCVQCPREMIWAVAAESPV